ncbi:MAG: Uma2 family endonuclease [Halothece sp.]
MTAQNLEPNRIKNHSLQLSGINWQQFKSIETSFDSISGVRLIYLDGALEIVILGKEHEYYKSTISLLLEAYLRAKKIRFYRQGSATLGDQEITGQKEPDESYSIGSQKERLDLVIEVVVSSGGINTLEIYKRIGIQEVWFWEDSVLKIYSLQETYQLLEKSSLFPDLNVEVLTKYITYYDQYDAVTEFLKELSLA